MSDFEWDVQLEVAWDVDPADEPAPADWEPMPDGRLREPIDVQLFPVGEVAESTFTLNNRDRMFDPTNTAAPLNLVPSRHARLTVAIGGTTHDLYRGFVEDWPPVWPEYNQGLVEVRLVDALAQVALIDADVDLPAQKAGERLNTLLDLAGWPAGRRDIDAGVVQLDPYEQQSASLLRVMIDTNDSEDGLLTVSPSGDVVFRDRHHDFNAETVIEFGPGGHEIAAVAPRFGARTVQNWGRIELADGRVFEIVDDASVTKFRERPWTTRDLPLPETEAIAMGQWRVVRFAQPHLELDGLRVHGGGDTTKLAEILDLRLGQLAVMNRNPPGGGTAEMTGRITHLEHSIAKAEWSTSANLASYHGDRDWFTWDDPDLGWDSGAVWAP